MNVPNIALEQKKEYMREYRKRYFSIPENAERQRAAAREWARKHFTERQNYNLTHQDEKKAYMHQYHLKQRIMVLQHYGGNPSKCACCGEPRIEFLTVDHIENNGAIHRREIGNTIVEWLIRNDYPEGYKVLCWNCNCSKGMYGQCPHNKGETH
jgi:hypothetical protein